MENEIQTHTDYEWDSRINSLINRLMYDQEIDPKTTNRYELEAAKLIIKLRSED